MPIAKGFAPAYNVQTAVDAEHALIVAHLTDLRSCQVRRAFYPGAIEPPCCPPDESVLTRFNSFSP
jgi:hypothetical protein